MAYLETKLEKLRKEMEHDIKLKEYLEDQNNHPGTELNKRLVYLKYTNLHQMTMTELLQEAKEDEKKGLDMDERRIKKRLKDLTLYFQGKTQDGEGKIKNATARTYMKYIKAFYNYYYITLPRVKISRPKRSRGRVLTLEEAKLGLNHCDDKYKAMFHLQMVAGFDVSTACSLNYSHFINAISKEILIKDIFDIYEISSKIKKNKDIIGTWIYTRIKTSNMEDEDIEGDEVYTFSTHEALLSICEYLQIRDIMDTYPTSLNDPLFVNNGRRINPNTAVRYAGDKNDEMGFGRVNKKRVFVTHNFRKMFSNALFGNNMEKLKIDWFLGHAVSDEDYAYFSAPENLKELKEEYKRCSKNLIFNPPEYMDVTDERIIELEEQLQKERNEVKELKKSFDGKLVERDEQTKPLMWLAKVINADPELAEQFKKSALKYNIN